jgi:hypothetical protein
VATSGPHPLVTLDIAERELLQLLERDGLEVLALLRFAVVRDRGALVVSLAPAPAVAELEQMDTETRGQLADALRRIANVVDPGGRTWTVRKVDHDTFYVERGDYRFGPYVTRADADTMQHTLNVLEREGA